MSPSVTPVHRGIVFQMFTQPRRSITQRSENIAIAFPSFRDSRVVRFI